MEQYFIDEDERANGEQFDFRRYYRSILKRWWLVAVVTVVITAPWLWYLSTQPPIYEAEAKIKFNNFGGTDPTLALSRKMELTSRSFAERVVAQLGLSMSLLPQNDHIPHRNEIFADFSTSREPIPGDYLLKLMADQTYELHLHVDDQNSKVIKQGLIDEVLVDACHVNGFSFTLANTSFDLPVEIPFKVVAFRKAVKSFQGRTNVGVDKLGTLMTVTLTDTDPDLVAEMTNRLAQLFIEESANLKNQGVSGRRKILEEQLELIKSQLDESDRALKDFQERYSTYLDTDENKKINDMMTLGRQKDDLQEIINTLRGLLAKLDEGETSANGNSAENNELANRYIMSEIARLGVFGDDANMVIERKRLEDLESTYREITSRYSPENVKAKETMDEIKRLHVKIEASARKKIQELESQVSSVKQDVVRAEGRLRQLPTQQYQLSELTRENKVLERQYLDLLAKTEDARISEAVSSEDIEILDSAIVPELPTNRDKKQKAVFGGVFGLMMGIGLVLTLEFLDKTIKTVDDVKKTLKLTVLGTIPQIDISDVFDFQDSEKIKQIDQQLVTHDYSPTPVGEAYRSLRTNLLFSKDNGRIQSLVVTSNEPGDGKSFTAANLAITLAQLKSKTVLIDSDLRRGVLHNTFGMQKEPGLSNYLTSGLPLNSVLRETHIPNLMLISCGSLIPNPSELLGSHQMQRFLDEIRRKFEVVIFDTPPLNAATDAVVVGTQVDGTVVVIRAGKTHRDLARQKMELYNNVPAKVLGAILNGTTADMAHPGYSYYHY
jgi:tyrosine-protein kinase Etk/Wzc